jgi:hypothetical protein
MRPPSHPPGYENRMNKQTYEVKVCCSNCGNYHDFDVPKRTLAKDYIKDQICPTCECRETLEMYE